MTRRQAWSDVNAHIAAAAGALVELHDELELQWTFLCECECIPCEQTVTTTLAVFRRAREHGAFVLVDGHQAPGDTILELLDGIVLVVPRAAY